MSTSRDASSQRRWLIAGIIYSLVILSVGLLVSIVTEQWLAIVCAVGLVVIPVGGARVRSRRSRR